MATKRKINILPDSTGAGIVIRSHIEMSYTNRVQTLTKGTRVVGQSTNTIAFINRVIPATTTTGQLYLTLDDTNPDNNFENGEVLLINGSAAATVSTSTDVYGQNYQLISYDNPFHGQVVDYEGAANVRFPDGPIAIDSHGRARTSTTTPIAIYGINNYTIAPGIATVSSSAGSGVSFDTVTFAKVLSLSTGSNDYLSFTSNYYHVFVPGQSQILEGSISSADSGKDGVIRRWGYYDENDGAFFMLSGSSFGFVIRSSTSGTPIDTFISQSEWNIDTLDGLDGISNRSNLALDVTQANRYWLELQWPVGTTRFGIYRDNQKLVAHKFESNSSYPIIRTPSLPLKAELFNDSGGSDSTTNLNYFEAFIGTEGLLNFDAFGYSNINYNTGPMQITNTEVPIFSMRTKDTLFGRTVRGIADIVGGFVVAKSGSQDALVKLNLYVSAPPFVTLTLTGSTYTANASNIFSIVDIDDTATAVVSGSLLRSLYFQGVERTNFDGFTEPTGIQNIGNNYDLSKREVCVTAQTVVSGAVADFEAQFTWREIVD